MVCMHKRGYGYFFKFRNLASSLVIEQFWRSFSNKGFGVIYDSEFRLVQKINANPCSADANSHLQTLETHLNFLNQYPKSLRRRFDLLSLWNSRKTIHEQPTNQTGRKLYA